MLLVNFRAHRPLRMRVYARYVLTTHFVHCCSAFSHHCIQASRCECVV